jgi:hypothetical protein
MGVDTLGPWQGAALALAAAFAWAGACRLLGRPHLGAAGAGLGLAAGLVLTLGSVTASPRQLPERLPLLAVAGAAGGLLLTLLGGGGRRDGVAAAAAALVLPAGAWWIMGAPQTLIDLHRVAVPALAVLVLLAALHSGLRGPWQATGATAVLLAGLALSAPLGPWLFLAAVVLAASCGAAVAGPAWPAPPRLPVALVLGALVAAPLLGRGAAADWTVAAAPLLALWVAPTLATRLPGRAAVPLAWIIAGGLPLVFTWLLRRGP